jgi:hypothetical protein
MNSKTLTILGLMGILAVIKLSVVNSAESYPTSQDLWFDSDNFASDLSPGFTVTTEGLTLIESSITGVYISPVLTAPIAFNAIVPQWIANVPEGSSLEIALRTKTAAGDWSQWYHIHAQPDWMLPEDIDLVGDMVTVPAADVTHRAAQFSVSFGRDEDVAAPVLQQLRLTFINSSEGPSAEELVARQMALNAARGEAGPTTPDDYPKPFVVSREVWCTDPACDYSDGLEYYPVSHLIVHHTVSNNDNSDWAAVMRAIWRFHTFNRGWGDIGYNYLVDMNGVLYEGHLGGDDVVGIHSGEANTGSMALALIGTFTLPDQDPPGIVPPQVMLNAAVELLSWKADQRDIDVYNASSSLPNIAWGLPHLMGHRDVYGGTNTACPGDQAYALLPWLRDQVAAHIGLVSPYLYVDELSSAFTRSAINWFEGPNGCGHNGHSYYTWSTTDPGQSTNWGEWRPQLPQDGRYEIQVYAPYCFTNAAETNGARYEIHHAGGVSNVTVSHNDNVGLWMSLGHFDLQAGGNTLVRLTDLTTTDSGLGVWFDAIRLRSQEPLPDIVVSNEQPADAWLNQPAVLFTWNISYPPAVASTILEVATDIAFTSVLLRQEFAGSVTSFTHNFDQEYANLYWRVIVRSVENRTSVSTPTHFSLDTTAPVSSLVSIRELSNGTYYLAWQGSDGLSGIAQYNVEYRAEDSLNWSSWLANVTIPNAIFAPPDPEQVYWFRSQAIDQAGNVEAPHAAGDVSTAQAILLPHDIILPIIKLN